MKLKFIVIMSLILTWNSLATAEDTYWSARAHQFFLNGDYEQAITSYDKALELDRSNVTILINRGLALNNLGRFNEAINSFDKAIQLNSSAAESWNLWMNKGMALANMGKPDDALSCFKKATQINPQDPKGWNNMGVVLREQGKYQDALANFNKAIEIDPLYEIARTNKEMTQQDLYRLQEVNEFYELDNMLRRSMLEQGANP
jgi:tetratricopeptide (TPR) repeat protein